MSASLLGLNPVTLVRNNPSESRKVEQLVRTLSFLICNPNSLLQTTAAVSGGRLLSLFNDICLNQNSILCQRTAELDAELQARVGVSLPPSPDGGSNIPQHINDSSNDNTAGVSNISYYENINAFFSNISSVSATAKTIIRDHKRNIAAETLLMIIGDVECFIELAIRSPYIVRFTKQRLGVRRSSSRYNGWIIIITISCIKALIRLFLQRRNISEIILSIKAHLTNIVRSVLGHKGRRLPHSTTTTQQEMYLYGEERKVNDARLEHCNTNGVSSTSNIHYRSPGLVIPQVVVAPTIRHINGNVPSDTLKEIIKKYRNLPLSAATVRNRPHTGSASVGFTYLRNPAEYLAFFIDMFHAVHPALWAIMAYIYYPKEHFRVGGLLHSSHDYISRKPTTAPNLFPSSVSVSPLSGTLQPSWSAWRLMFAAEVITLLGSFWISSQRPPVTVMPVHDHGERNKEYTDIHTLGGSCTGPWDAAALARIHKCEGNILKWALRDPFFSVVLKDLIRENFVNGWVNRYVPLVGGMVAGQVEYFLTMQKYSFMYTNTS
eukprot:Tbor_TRINITY_DN5330_c0_g1::TRINITY_DN5330_c0_g1_i1::g.5229::m.5229